MPIQYFLLDSDVAGYAAALSALKSYTDAKVSFTTTQTVRDAANDSTHKIVKANITEAELDADGDLVDLRTANYPNELCRHRWSTLENFRALGGFHKLGESVRSFEAMAGRSMKFIRKQQTNSYTAENYGELGDGSSHYDALNGPQDPAIDVAALGDAVWNKATSYVICDGAHVRWGDLGNGGNPDAGNGIFPNGYIEVEDATADPSHKIFAYCDWDMMPGMMFGSYTHWERNGSPGWDVFDAANGIYVNGYFNGGFAGTNIGAGSTSTLPEGDVDDVTQDQDTLLKRHMIKGTSSLSNLSSTSGRSHFYCQGSGATSAVPAVHVWDGSSFTDVTAAASDATADDFEIFAASAPNGAYIALVFDDMVSAFDVNLSQLLVGGTFELQYSRASDYAQFDSVVDPSNLLTTNTFQQSIKYNPKNDWVTGTVNGDTGYVVRIVKIGGTVTQACRGDQLWQRPGAMFLRRWNDSAPTRGLCAYTPGPGWQWGLNTKGNIEFVRMRVLVAPSVHGNWNRADDVTITGGQWCNIGDMRFNNGLSLNWLFRAGSYGSRYWSIADHNHPTGKDDPFIQDILERVQAGINAGIDFATNGVDPDLAAFDDMGDWADFSYVNHGPYGSGGEDWQLDTDGFLVRWPGGFLQNDQAQTIISVGGIDDHGFAYYGQKDHAGRTYKRIGIENGRNMTDFYAQANGNNDAPVSGASSAHTNAVFSHCYWSGVGNADAHFPRAMVFENDADVGNYDDGSGVNTGNKVFFCGAKDIVDPSDGYSGGAFAVISRDTLHQFWYNLVDNPGRDGAFGTNGGFSNNGPRSTNAVTFDGTSTYNDITTNLMDSGNIATPLFAAGTAGNVLYMGQLDRHCRRFTFDITTAGVGAPTLAYEYSSDGSTWSAVSNLSDGTSAFTTSGTVTWNRPPDASLITVNGAEKYWVRCRIVSGSFSVIPQADEINTYASAGSIDVQFNRVKNIDVANECRYYKMVHNAGQPFQDSGIIIDQNNIIELGPGQDSDTNFYHINGVALDTLAQWQARSKPALTNDNLVDSVFGTNNMLV